MAVVAMVLSVSSIFAGSTAAGIEWFLLVIVIVVVVFAVLVTVVVVVASVVVVVFVTLVTVVVVVASVSRILAESTAGEDNLGLGLRAFAGGRGW